MKQNSNSLLLCVCLLMVQVSARDCYLSCDEVQITYDKQICYQNCDMKYIVGITVGGFFGIVFLACIICLCRHRNFDCVYFTKRRLKKLYNTVDSGDFTTQKFQAQKQNLIKGMKKTGLVNNFFFRFEQKVYPMKIEKQSILFVEEEPFNYKVTFQGEDDFEKFTAEGNFLCRKGALFLWFLKQYQNPESVIKYGLKHLIIFQTQNVSPKSWQGGWHGQQKAEQTLLGNWALVMKVVGAHNRLVQINTESYMI